MATKAKKMTGKDISTADVLRVVGEFGTFAEMAKALGLTAHTDRALDQALQREKRKGVVRFDLWKRRWVKVEEKPTSGEPKHGLGHMQSRGAS